MSQKRNCCLKKASTIGLTKSTQGPMELKTIFLLNKSINAQAQIELEIGTIAIMEYCTCFLATNGYCRD